MNDEQYTEFLDRLLVQKNLNENIEIPGEQLVAFMTRFFAESGKLPEKFDLDTIGNGVYYITDINSGMFETLIYDSIPLEHRLECISAIEYLFTDLFDKHCNEELGHIHQKISRLNMACYMWWDAFPSWGTDQIAGYQKMNELVLNLLEKILCLKSLACQESALHGLSHWNDSYPDLTVSIIDNAIENINPLLLEYAEDAKEGLVL